MFIVNIQKAEDELREAQRRLLESSDDVQRAEIQIEIDTYEALIKAAQEGDK